RVVVVDGAEDMNRNAANALLKILEEPPQRAILILVSHAPGRLLPTIRSRCRRLDIKSLPQPLLMDLLAHRLPHFEEPERARVAALSEGSRGRGVALAEADGIELYGDMSALLQPLPKLDAVRLYRLADKVARGRADGAFRTAGELLLAWLTRLLKVAA